MRGSEECSSASSPMAVVFTYTSSSAWGACDASGDEGGEVMLSVLLPRSEEGNLSISVEFDDSRSRDVVLVDMDSISHNRTSPDSSTSGDPRLTLSVASSPSPFSFACDNSVITGVGDAMRFELHISRFDR